MASSMATTTSTRSTIVAGIDAELTLQDGGDAPGGWTVARLPRSAELLGVRGPVKVVGTVDDVAIEATALPMGDGTHILPVRAAVRRALGKGGGDVVHVRVRPRD